MKKTASARRTPRAKSPTRLKKGGCGRNCKDWKRRAEEVSANQAVIQGKIDALGGVKPVDAKASKMAEFLGLFGADAPWVKKVALRFTRRRGATAR